MSIDLSTTVDDIPIDPDGQETICQITTAVDANIPDLPLHIVFCLDKSGSMAGDVSGSLLETFSSSGTGKMDIAKDGVGRAVEELRPGDHFGIVAFSTAAERVTGAIPANASGKEDALERVSDLSCGGGTDITAGIDESRILLDRMPDEDAVEWIVLVSDGKDRVDVSTVVNRTGASIYAAGVGEDYKESLVRKLATESGGEWKHISNGELLNEFFANRVAEAGQVVASSATLHLRPRNGTTVTEVFKRTPQVSEEHPAETFDGLEVGPVDLRADDPPEFLVRLDAPAHQQDPNVELLEVELRTDVGSVTDTAVVPYVQTAIETTDRDSELRRELENIKASAIAIRDGASEALDYIDDEESETVEAIRALDEADDDAAREQKDEISRLPGRKTDNE